MRTFRAVALILLVLGLAPTPRSLAQGAGLGTIGGEVGFPGFTTTSVSVTAVGGGNTVQTTAHDSGTYALAVPGGSDYAVSASCGLSGGNNTALTVSFSRRSLLVAPGAWVPNDYLLEAGIVRFQVTITGDPTVSSAAAGSWAAKAVSAGEKTATYSSGTPATAARSYSWDLPVVPNQQIELTANVDVQGGAGTRRYAFSKAGSGPYLLAPADVAAGAVVVVPLEIHYEENASAPSVPTYRGWVAGTVDLLGLPSALLTWHRFNSKDLFTNPGAYKLEYTLSGGNPLVTPLGTATTQFHASLDGGTFRWPYVNGDVNSNRVTVYPDTTTTFDLQRAGGFLEGAIRISGTQENEDLKAITLSLTGVGRVYDPVAKAWTYRENYWGSAAVSRDAVTSNVKRPWERDYRLFLTTGDWDVSSLTLTRQLTAPSRTSSVTFSDRTLRYDGQSYFGTPLHIVPGTTQQDFDYCVGSAVFRFWDPAGRGLRNPFVTGNGNHYTDGAIDLSVSTISASYSSTDHVARPEVEVFGPPADYRFTTIRVTADDGKNILFPARNLSLSCGTTKLQDFPGPTLVVESPVEEVITNSLLLPVYGRAFAGSSIAGVTVNGEAAALTPVAGGSPNEVSFHHDLAAPEGESLVTVTVTEGTGAQATDQLRVFADRWAPSVAIVTPAEGETFFDRAAGVPLRVEAADLGYGYSLAVALDGTLLHTALGGAGVETPVELAYEDVLRGLTIGPHVITATALDRAGNSTTASVTVYMQEPPPVLHGLVDLTLDATSPEGAVGTFAVTATSTCDPDPAPELLPAPVLVPQGHSQTAGGDVAKTFQWEPVVAAWGGTVQYQVQVSGSLDFAAVPYASAWQSGTSWTQALPPGTWYWRVTARDALQTDLQSLPATGNSFRIAAGGAATATFPILHHTDVTLSGGVYPNPGDPIWVGPFTEDGDTGDVDRSFLSFDTSSLGDGASVAAATLHLDYQYKAYVQETSATNVYASNWVFPGTSATYGDLGDLLASSPSIGPSRPLGMIPFAIPPEHIQTGGVTKFGLAAAVENFGYPANAAPGYSRSNSFLEVGLAPAAALAAPVLIPQANPVSGGEDVDVALAWDEVASADGNPVEYRVELSSFPSFSTVIYSSPWLAETVWDQTLPIGAWHWRVTARDAVETGLTSEPAASSFVVAYQPPPTPPGEVSVTCAPSSGTLFPVGVTTVACGALDACGGWAEGAFLVTVVDATPLTVTAPADRTVEATGLLTPVELGEAGAGGMQPIVVSHDGPASYPVGTTVVTWTATDGNGNMATATQNIAVRDTTPPVLTVPGSITVLLNTPLGSPEVQAFLGGATATDTVDGSVAVTAAAPGVFDTVGETPVTFTAVDASGNEATETAVIRVVYGCGESFLSPVSLGKPFKQGSTVPVKIAFCDASGAAVTSAAVRLFLYPVSDDVPAEEPLEIQATGNEDSGNMFRLTEDHYQYNLSTKNLSAGSYQVRAAPDDGTFRTAPLALK